PRSDDADTCVGSHQGLSRPPVPGAGSPSCSVRNPPAHPWPDRWRPANGSERSDSDSAAVGPESGPRRVLRTTVPLGGSFLPRTRRWPAPTAAPPPRNLWGRTPQPPIRWSRSRWRLLAGTGQNSGGRLLWCEPCADPLAAPESHPPYRESWLQTGALP